MHEHDADTDAVQNRDLLYKRARGFGRDKGLAAGFEHEGLVFVHADIGRGMLECRDHDGLFIAAESRHGDDS